MHKSDRVEWAFSFSIGRRSLLLGNQCRATSREKKPACLDFRAIGRGHRGLKSAVLGPTREYWTFTSRGDLNEHNDLTPYIIYDVQVNSERQITAH